MVQTVDQLFQRCNRKYRLRRGAFNTTMKTFRIPASPGDLLDDSNELALSVQRNTAVADLKTEEIQEFADGVALMVPASRDVVVTPVLARKYDCCF